MSAAPRATLSDVRHLDLQVIEDRRGGRLSVMQAPNVPFPIRRVFTVSSEGGEQRGHHAHRECAQLLVCQLGACRVVVDDGGERKSITLDSPRRGLYIPPSIWAEQDYIGPTLLMVLCDQTYSEADYIRDYAEFLNYRHSR